eukprot:CAMPEP_0176023124 /NCGR_PEP_ID=MMETSP0120_2-20121206/11274_1 /TAXON_ID=160619 /ORGANISM="Kryptoperidinium foliaceum, Strain CCMP 1326" /LENGTH=81 /DNA_ID=CAMNT_0017356281 /DNA_START=239 /DNA_END=481 /DNA_ORIENTATION=-
MANYRDIAEAPRHRHMQGPVGLRAPRACAERGTSFRQAAPKWKAQCPDSRERLGLGVLETRLDLALELRLGLLEALRLVLV